MTDLVNRIEKLKELIEAKKGAEVHQETIQKTSDPEPPPLVPEHQKSPMDTGKRPSSLEGYSFTALQLMRIDGQMSESEKSWFDKKSMYRPGVLTPLSWMG